MEEAKVPVPTSYAAQMTASLAEIQQQEAASLSRDPGISRPDTARAVLLCLEKLEQLLLMLQKQAQEVQEGCYWVVLNVSQEMMVYCRQLRRAGFLKDITRYLAGASLAMETNIVAAATRYMDWRLNVYRELAEVYEEMGALKAATKVVAHALRQLQTMKDFEEAELPVPESVKITLEKGFWDMRALELKYGLMTGTLTPDQWKKRLDEVYGTTDKTSRLIYAMTSLSIQKFGQSRIVQQQGFSIPWKPLILTYIIEMAAPDIKTVCQSLQEMEEKKQRDASFFEASTRKQNISIEEHTSLENPEDEPNLQELLAANRAADAKMIKEKAFKTAISVVPFTIHLQLLRQCYDCKLWDHFFNLAEWAEVRIRLRRLEVPFVTDVDLLVSSIQDPKIPKGYERLDVDLNIAHLRQELAKIGISLEPGKAPRKIEKKEEAKKPDPKAKGKPPPKEAKKTEEVFEEERDVVGLVKHSFVYLVVKRGNAEESALSQLNIAFGGVDISPEVVPGGKAVALPVEQYRRKGEEETPLTKVPYLMALKLEQTHGSRLQLVTDILPIISKSPNTPVPLGYTKLPTDLRLTPIDQERLPNNTYVYIAYQTEKDTSMLVKDFRIITALRRLEQNKSTAEDVQPVDRLLAAGWDVDLLAQLAQVIREEIRGGEGEEYAQARQDLLTDVALKIWADFVNPVLQAKARCDDRGLFGEISESTYASVQQRWGEIEAPLRSALDSALRVLTLKSDLGDPLTVLNLGLTFVHLSEAAGEYRAAVQTLRRLQGEVVKVREAWMTRGVEARRDFDLPLCISTSPVRVAALRKEIRTQFMVWKHATERKLRDLARKKPLDEDEGDEEQWEVVKNAGEREQLEKEEAEHALESVLLEEQKDLHALHVQILMNLYKCELELERRSNSERVATLKTYASQGIDINPHNSGISASVFMKSKQGTGKSAKKVKGDVQSLQQTLQETGRLPPKKPQLSSIEKTLAAENSKNVYAQALLYMQMAKYKANPQEQKALLKDALGFIKQAEVQEEAMWRIAVENAEQVLAAQQWNHSTGDTHLDYYPFRLLADVRVIEPRLTPEKPVVVARSMTSVTVKMVSFNPKVTNKFDIKKAKRLALYGKEARSGTDVSLTNVDLENLNNRMEIDAVVTIGGLTPHEEYHFAVAAYDEQGECIGGIGETCATVTTLLPLPVNMILCYLAQMAYGLKQYMIALKAANIVLQRYTDTRTGSHLMGRRLKLSEIHSCSKAEIKDILITFTLYVSALQLSDQETLQLQLLRDPDYRLVTHLETQERTLKYCNVLLMALELAVMIEDISLIKDTIWKLNETLCPLLELKVTQAETLHALLKVYTALCAIPAEFSEPAIRKICALATQQLMKTCMQLNLAPLLVSVLTTDVQFPRRQITPEAIEAASDPEAMGLYEVLARCDETAEISKKMADKWKEALATWTDPAAGAVLRQDVDAVLEALTLMKSNPDGGLQKLNQAPNAHYLEWCVKAIRMLMEKGTDLKIVGQSLALVNVPQLPLTMAFIQERVAMLHADQVTQAVVSEAPISTEENPLHRLWASEVFLLSAAVDFLNSYKPQNNEAHSFLDIQSIEVGLLVKEEIEIKPVSLEKPLELLMKSAAAARLSQAWSQLENSLRVCTNVLTCFLPSPLALAQSEAWASIAVLAQCSLDFLEANSGLDVYRPGYHSQRVEFEGSQHRSSAGSQRSESKEETRAWFLSRETLDIYLHVNIVALAVQCLLCVKKWQALVRICDRLNAVTQNHFAGPILPFKIFAETTLYEAAKAATERKLEELEARNQEFESWRSNTKRRKTRQAMLTGEIPQEQLDYERDVKVLNAEIETRQTTENELRNKLKRSEEQLEAIKRGANTAYESLVQARKLLEQYGTEARALEREAQDGANRMKRKAQKAFAGIVLQSYRKAVDILRKRRERSLLAQALNELGSLCLVEGNLEEAEAVWSDSVDTVFQSLYVISSFRKLMEEELLAEKYGIVECVLAGNVLTKLALHCYESKDAHRARECLLFAAQLFAAPLKLSLPHPSTAVGFKLYRMQEFTPNFAFLDLNRVVPLADLAVSLEYVSRNLLENYSYVEVLPLASFLEALACDYLLSPGVTVKARNLRAAALSHLGYIDEALETLQKIIAMKDMPSSMAKRSLVRERDNAFWTAKIHFVNSLPPEHPQNQEAVQYLLKAEIPVSLTTTAGSFAYIETLYLKGLLLARLGQSESLEEATSEPLRKQLNAEADRVLRLVLKTLSYEEELTRTQEEWNEGSGRSVEAYVQGRAPDILPADALIREQISALLFVGTEENLTSAEKRINRLKLMVRTREAVAAVRQSEGELTAAVKVLKQCLINLQKYSTGQLMVETGTEKDLFPQGAVIEEAKKEPAKKAKDAKGRAESPSTAVRPTSSALAAAAAERYAAANSRDFPNPSTWLRVKYRLLTLLYAQARFEECGKLLAEVERESMELKDALYLRQGLEIKAYLLLREGKLDDCLVAFEQMRTFASNQKLTDPGFACGLGNYGQLLAHRTHFIDAWEVLRQARNMLWTYLMDCGLVVVPEDLNKDAGDRGVLVIGSVKEEVKVVEGKPGDKKKPPVPDPKEEAGKKQRISASHVAAVNTTYTPANLYLPYKHQMVLLDLTYIQTWLQKDEGRTELPSMQGMMENLLAISGATVHLPNAVLAQVKLLSGKVERIRVYTEILEMQRHFVKLSATRKRYRKFARNIPEYSLASGRSLLSLPGFNEKLTENWLPRLLKSRETLEQAMRLASKECVLLNLEDCFRELYQVLELVKDLRPRVGFKYLENKSRPPESEGDGKLYFEDIREGDKLDQHRLLKEMTRTLTVLKDISEAKKYLAGQFSLLGTIMVQDATKVPRLVVQEILEGDYNCKKTYSAGLFDDSKKKTTLNSYDLTAYLLKNLWDMLLLPLGREWRNYALLKLHRFLCTLQPTYSAKNKFVWDVAPKSTSLAEVITAAGSCLGYWQSRVEQGVENVYLNYLFSHMDPDHIVRNDIGEEVGVLEFSHKDEFYYGEVRGDPGELSQCLQTILDLRQKFNASYQLSQEKYDRDMVYYRKDFKSILFKFATFFNESVSQQKEGETNVLREKAQMAIEELAPEVSEEVLVAVAAVLRSGAFVVAEANLNALFRFFHSLRYTA